MPGIKTIYIALAVILVAAVVTLPLFTPSDETVRIGLIAPLSGPFADWGRTIEEGARLALEDTEHNFVVDFQDSACEPQRAVSIANKFFDADSIKIVIGPGCVTGLRAIAPMAEKSKALLLSTGLLDDQIFEDHDNVINLATQISTEARYMADYLESVNASRVAVIHGTNYFGQEYGRRLPELLEQRGINVTSVHPTGLDEKDFRTVILKMSEADPDAVFIHQGELQTGTFLNQLREMGHDVPVYSYYLTEQQSVLEAAGPALEGLAYTSFVNSADQTVKENFEKRYAEKFGADRVPSPTSLFVYDGIMILDMAMDACSPKDTACIENFFKGLGNYSGVSGDMKFSEDGSVTRPFGIKRVENRTFVWVKQSI